ncbi:MAG: hypothetical protein ACI89L_001238 [Phycisphaerales bacterium]
MSEKKRAKKTTTKKTTKKTATKKTTTKKPASKRTTSKKSASKRASKKAAAAPASPAPLPVSLVRPSTPAELADFLREHLGLEVPSVPLVAGHTSPMDYLVHSFFEDTVPRDSVVWANRGGGKTFLAAVATLLDLVFKPGIEIRILGGSLEQAGRMHEHLRTLFEREPFEAMVSGKVTDKRIRLTNASRVELLAQSQTSVRGTRVQKLRCDEVELFDPAVWEAAQLVTREKNCGGVFVPGSIECLSTMHRPFGIMHKLVKASSRGEGALEVFPFTHENAAGQPVPAIRRLHKWGVLDVLGACGDEHECDSCPLSPACGGRAKERDARGGAAGHISVSEARRLMNRVGEGTWEAEMLCLRPMRSDCVLPEFDTHTHVVGELPSETDRWLWVCGMDFGFRAPTAVLWAGVDPAGVLWVYDERVVAGEILEKHIESIVTGQPRLTRDGTTTGKGHPRPTWVGIDPAGAQRSGQSGVSDTTLLKGAGLTVLDRRMKIEEGLTLLRARLAPANGPARLFVHRRCERLIESLEKYHYPPDNPEATTPVKDGSDHAVDALRYLVANLDKPYKTARTQYA